MKLPALLFAAVLTLSASTALRAAAPATATPPHRFEIGDTDFLLDGQRLQIRCGEMHFARVPREYWRQRLQMMKAMGLNTVCAYLFWNYHEWNEGQFDWSGDRDAAEFCRIAQEEGLWVILRPGPYACAEWEMGGLPWWLLSKGDGNFLRTNDPRFLGPCRAWLNEVGRVLGPLQITRGGPVLMVQVENEYGFFGRDLGYLRAMRQLVLDAGFTVPLFDCNPTNNLARAHIPELFSVVNFGSDPAGGFRVLRTAQSKGPLMCGEFYSGWFDTWGKPHKGADTKKMLTDLEYMLQHDGSFSIYMAHGGTTFGLWGGCDRPFSPDTSSYDYDAPISEAGWTTDKFTQLRALMSRYLLPGETLPAPPATFPVADIPAFTLNESAAVFANLPPSTLQDESPRNLEAYGISRGLVDYRTTLPAGPAGTLEAANVRDLAWVFVDGRPSGVMDVRTHRFKVNLPARAQPARVDVLLYTIARVNFGIEVHDRKGVQGPVTFTAANSAPQPVKGWQILPIDFGANAKLPPLAWKPGPATAGQPAFWHGTFNVAQAADTFLDVAKWGLGIVWINGRCLGRFWDIGPTQTMFLPGVWLHPGFNDIVVLDLKGPEQPILSGVKVPVMAQLHAEKDFFAKNNRAKLQLGGVTPVLAAAFAPGSATQDVKFPQAVTGRQFCLESLDAFDGKEFASVAEIALLDAAGNVLDQTGWTIAYADSEEDTKEDGSALNAINGQASDFWHTAWGGKAPFPKHPHRLVIDLGASVSVSGFRYTPRQGPADATGRIKDYRVYVGDRLAAPQ